MPIDAPEDDEEVDDLPDVLEDADQLDEEGIEANVAFVDFGKSLFTSGSLEDKMTLCCSPSPLTLIVPSDSQRPWTSPSRYIYLYEDCFTKCGFRFPIPRVLIHYCLKRKIAILQLFAILVRNIFCLKMLGERYGVDVDVDHLEELTTFTQIRKEPGLHYVSARRGFEIINGAPN